MFHFKQGSFFFLYKNNFQKIMPPNKNLTAGQTVRSWSQAGQVQPSFVLNWKHLENVKFHKIHSKSAVILRLNLKNLVSRWVENIRKQSGAEAVENIGM